MHQLLTASRIKVAIQAAKSSTKELWLSDDGGARGTGRLVIRVSATGTQRFYYRTSRAPANPTKVISLGVYSRTQRVGYLTLSQARQRADELSSLRCIAPTRTRTPNATGDARASAASHSTDVKEISTDSSRVPKSTVGSSLLELCRLYAQKLEDDGKSSSRETKSLVKRHISPSPMAHLSARDIKPTAFTELLREIIDSSSGRTAAKVRSLLHAAYAQAQSAQLNPSAPRGLIDFGVETNPITGIDTLAKYSKARDRHLRDSEIRAVWQRLQLNEKSGIPVRALRLC